MPKKMFLLKTSCDSEDGTEGCDFAVVEIDHEIASRILRRRDLFLEAMSGDKDMYQMYFWHRGAFYFTVNPEWTTLTTLQEMLHEADIVEIGGEEGLDPIATFDTNDSDICPNTDCDQMVVMVDGVYWFTIVKHTDVEVITARIPFTTIETCLDPMVPQWPGVQPRGRIAFTTILEKGGFYLGLAEEGVPGYNPVTNFGPVKEEKDAKEEAKIRNEKLGLTEKEAFLIVCSSMGAQNLVESKKARSPKKPGKKKR